MEGLSDPPGDLSPCISNVSTARARGNSITKLSHSKINNEEEYRSNEMDEHVVEVELSSGMSDTDSSENDLEYVDGFYVGYTKLYEEAMSRLSELEMGNKDHSKTKMENGRLYNEGKKELANTTDEYNKVKGEYNDLVIRFQELQAKYKHNEDQEILQAKYANLVSQKDRLIASQLKRIEEAKKDNKDLRKALEDKEDAKYQEMQDDYNNMKANFENALVMKEEVIANQTKIIEEYDERLAALISNHENALKQKEDELEALGTRSSTTTLLRPGNANDMFKAKPTGKSSKNIDVNHFKCEFTTCNSLGVDCIKCNSCLKWMCEFCHGIPVSKCKPIFNKCQSLYFVCKTCEESALLNGVKINSSETPVLKCDKINNSKVIDEKLSNFGTVSKMVDEKLSVWNTKLQTIEQLPDEINQRCASFKEALTNNVPTATSTEVDFRNVLLETQNEERIQQRQRDARAKNIIIHGIPESLVNQKEHDANVVNELINLLDYRVAPSNINRVGRQKEQGSRPIKLIMSTLNDKESAMKSLGKLKDAPENFRKICVTDDYTQEERESIREKVAKAKRMTETQGEGKYIWRVRGTPKNGLIIKRFNQVNNLVANVNTEINPVNQD